MTTQTNNQSPNKSAIKSKILLVEQTGQTGSDTITIATESMKGCGEMLSEAYANRCGEIGEDNKLHLCPICQSKILTHKQDWEGFVNKLDGSYMAMHDEGLRKLKEEYKLALKILEGGK